MMRWMSKKPHKKPEKLKEKVQQLYNRLQHLNFETHQLINTGSIIKDQSHLLSYNPYNK